MKQSTRTRWVVLAVVAMSIGCTMKKQETPELSGPSEFGTSIGIAIAPDVLQQDGVSQSTVTVTARGPNGAPVANLALRAEIRVGGVLQDFGTLSARTVVTGSDGRAMLVYTAPPSPPISVDDGTIVDIGITPVGTDFNNTTTRFASLRLVPRGIIVPPAGLAAAFTVTPASPTAGQTVLFDASSSQAPANNPIASYSWSFGDGRSGSGRTTSHQYSTPGTYVARLTISDAVGRSAQVSQSITVSPGTGPVARFTFSPLEPVPHEPVHFTGVQSTAAPGRTIVHYTWDFGDGGPAATGMQASRTYTREATYTVTLTVTDDTGLTSSVAAEVPVQLPKAP
jgi:PKD repeat protein